METLKRIRKRQGRCYELAYRAMLYETGAEKFTLVHGTIRDWIGHAWIELGDGRVYDPVLNTYFLAVEYIAAMRAVAERRYNHIEAMRMAKHGNSGPWHATSGAGHGPLGR